MRTSCWRLSNFLTTESSW
uniref:Uncharacterized protein n=1 Tax=Macrostomum lignano TaxID=282301 RepID=A0A1I8FL26_9PLAT